MPRRSIHGRRCGPGSPAPRPRSVRSMTRSKRYGPGSDDPRPHKARPVDTRTMGAGARLSEGQTLMAAPTFRQLKDEYAALWHSMTVKPDNCAVLDRIANTLIAGKPRYQAVASKTGVPWAAIALIHQMECGGDWSLNI